jgi:5-formyltetrahydrofolate cyclo-ligase
MNADKPLLRRIARARRSGLSPEACASAAAAVATRVLAMPEVAAAHGVLAYAATREELDPRVLVDALEAGGARIAYPRVCGPGEITLHWSNRDELEPGYKGILEPPATAAIADVADVDLVLVPGVAFDAACNRLGMGGGFYDRLLPRLDPSAIAIGLAFDEQIVDEVPSETHDMAPDAVVTPSGVLRRAR